MRSLEVVRPAPRSIALAFVGLMRADELQDEYTVAFSQAGQLFQERLLSSLADAGLSADGVYVQRPVPSYPADSRVWFQRAVGTVAKARFRVVLLPFINVGPLKTLSIAAGVFVALIKWGWRHRKDQDRVILTYNVSAPPGIVSILAGRVIRASVVAVVADIQIPGSGLVARTALRRVEYWLQTVTLPRCDGLVVLTHNTAKDFAPNVPYIQVEGAVPNEGSQADATLPDAADCIRSTECGAPVVLMYAGGLSELKGTRLLLDAMRVLPGDGFRLWITGDGPLRGSVEAAAESDDRITYWGFAPYSQVRELMQKATLLVNPHSCLPESARYLFPSKLIEYLATGKPVISTVSTAEVMQEYGRVLFAVEEESPAALASVIERVASLPHTTLHEFGLSARAFVLREKSWSVQGQRIARFIRDCAAGTHSRHLRAVL